MSADGQELWLGDTKLKPKHSYHLTSKFLWNECYHMFANKWCAIQKITWVHLVSISLGHMRLVSANERIRYICNVFSHWLRLFSRDHRDNRCKEEWMSRVVVYIIPQPAQPMVGSNELWSLRARFSLDALEDPWILVTFDPQSSPYVTVHNAQISCARGLIHSARGERARERQTIIGKSN